jgi:hypothetical protein
LVANPYAIWIPEIHQSDLPNNRSSIFRHSQVYYAKDGLYQINTEIVHNLISASAGVRAIEQGFSPETMAGTRGFQNKLLGLASAVY